MARARMSPSAASPPSPAGEVSTTRACRPGSRFCPPRRIRIVVAARCRSCAAVAVAGGSRWLRCPSAVRGPT
eukprot:1803770-Lingulodinium_polyedra.AAC.1